MSVAVLFALLGVAIALPAAAQWKWRDKGGQIQYSDLPPPAGISEQDILQRPAAGQRRAAIAPPVAASAASASVAKMVEPELEAKRRKVDQEQAAKTKAEEDKIAATRADNCTRAKAYLRQLDDGLRISRVNDKGEREVLDDKQRAGETQRARDIISTDCK